MHLLRYLSVVLWIVIPAHAQDFSPIAGPDTPVPGGSLGETFDTFDEEHPPMVSGRCMAFRGTGDMGAEGIYLVREGAIEVVANLDTPVPGGGAGEHFAEFEEAFALDDCDVVFDGTGDAGAIGIYLKRQGLPLELAAGATTVAPGGGTFSGFEDPWLEGDVVVFVATTAGGACDLTTIYKTTAGGFVAVVDTCGGTPVPGGLPGETFAQLLETRPVLEDGVLSFTAEGDMGTRGIYAEVGGVLVVVADINTPIPGSGGAVFNQFGGISPTSGGDVVFLAAGPETMPPFSHAGLYRWSSGTLTTVFDLLDSSALPGWDPGDPILDFAFWFAGDLVTLGASGMTSPATLFLIQGAQISVLIATGDVLDGMTVLSLPLFAHCTGDRIVFAPELLDGAIAAKWLYLATLPFFEDGFESGDTTAWSSAVQ